jgi:hypothetical protein
MTPAAAASPVPVMAQDTGEGAAAAPGTVPGAPGALSGAPGTLPGTLPGTPLPPMLPDGRFTGEGVTGLTFPRRWTTRGIHPYDQVEWEIRTAAIGNEQGKTVFEQKDVEVPAFWSQLATNVVVSKYFRGHVGHEGRERSVRQLIDRVVDTITAWAETQHYFATPDDLEAFHDELTHLILHQ